MAVTNDHWNLAGFDFETVEQFLRFLISVQIYIGIRMCIASKKFAYAEGISTVARTHQDDIALPARDERQATQDECPHENVAQFGVSRDQRPQASCRDLQKLTGLGNPAADQAALPRDHRDLAREPTGLMGRDRTLAVKIRLHDLHASRKQDEKRHFRIVGLKQNLSRLNLSQLAAETKTTDLRLR